MASGSEPVDYLNNVRREGSRHLRRRMWTSET